jgi:hypothetical protein
MINKDEHVPNKTIALFADIIHDNFKYSEIDTMLSKPDKKRDWFDPNFYRCLPLTIGNQYGFVFKSQFDFYVTWNGGNSVDDLSLRFNEPEEELDLKFPRVESHFGFGVLTLNFPFHLRTPQGVNLITINPPNTILPNITVMTGVVESDNLRRNFTLNLKLQIPGITTFIPAGTPLAGILPVPRYFCDEFSLVDGEDIFSNKEYIEEIQASLDATTKRTEVEAYSKNSVGQDYLRGRDVYGNKFLDHQGPS